MFLFRSLALLLALCLPAANVLLAQSSNSTPVSGQLRQFLSCYSLFGVCADSQSSDGRVDSGRIDSGRIDSGRDSSESASAYNSSATIAALDSSSNSGPDLSPDLSQDHPQSPAQPQAQPQAGQNPGAVSVQARIRARREQRRAQAIHDAYSHLYETYVGMGYLRFSPGPNLQHVTYYSWNAEFTRYFSQRLGVTVGGRGYYGSPFTYVNFSSITRPAISTYMVMGGPVYRIYLQPKYSISGRVMGGWALGHFSGDTNKFGSTNLGLWPDGNTYAINGGLIGEYNVSPGFTLRLNGEYVATGFGSTMQNSFGFTSGFIYRFGKQ